MDRLLLPFCTCASPCCCIQALKRSDHVTTVMSDWEWGNFYPQFLPCVCIHWVIRLFVCMLVSHSVSESSSYWSVTVNQAIMLGGVLPRVSITCVNPLLTGPMKYCNYCDVTSIYSLNSRKLSGRLSYNLGMRLSMAQTEVLVKSPLRGKLLVYKPDTWGRVAPEGKIL